MSLLKVSLSLFLLFAIVNSRLLANEELDQELQKKLETLLKDFNGNAGVYVHHLKTGQKAAVQADELFPTASMIKVPILLTIFKKIEDGQAGYLDTLLFDTSRVYPGDDILASFKSAEKITLSRLILLMITMSDNTASLWLQELAGGGTAINALMDELGFPGTKVNSRTPGRKLDYQKYGWGQTTPREMCRIFTGMRNGAILSESASQEMYRILCNIYWNSEALSQIPPYVQAASKQGAVNQSRSETVLVNAPSGDYVFSIITRNQQDSSWQYDNEGYMLIRTVSRMLWEYFEPDHPWHAVEPQRWDK